MKHIITIIALVLTLISCNKKGQDFKIKSVTLLAHRPLQYTRELLRVRLLDGVDSQKVIGETAGYPASLPLPATLLVNPAFQLKLYSQPCYVQLWGDSTGLIGTAKLNMKDYKIIFPLEMEVGNADMKVTLTGKWDQQ
ncbi:hypothetical protein A4H97_25365 [Niastella yeongjuensis]|uniref:Uncharacterized protein n=1 Tax=Niastella yeongjuensis TaxID=354355 RepID=A0A1V9F2V3_9BACT|nr:hypothetical protein [Niastella yeongjuensis]OQP52651.1 hypothetical protein A4H97_25365 [Niastella yeongjuensis]SEP33058.1 hypothetical protein SAMN05660816_05280 [Niastella yeongjuensis]